ncbi:predicted protein [Naegleria gruberi]|uniref:Predicted protein n=1 Tax=Naegleria gruberi TaxID=5762 RepID=D2VKU2_NAEGR|nr:uncharacterized protein NAEGRDRAFT_69551 [Naegleria gruberi]EFC42429.1 predicted protein [Naegleria gruberi]|eukprot:XP_002675173.1 predicted protein [Naegleria gruberi strain NEG-M]
MLNSSTATRFVASSIQKLNKAGYSASVASHQALTTTIMIQQQSGRELGRNFTTTLCNTNPNTTPAANTTTAANTINGEQGKCPYHHDQKVNQPVKSWSEVPGPKGYPIVGNAMDFQKNASNLSDFLMSLCNEYGDMVKLNVFKFKMLVLANPYLLADMFKREEKRSNLDSFRYYKLQRNQILTPVEMKFEEDWNSMRQLYNIAMKPEFQETVTIPQLSELNGEFIRRLINNLQSVPESEMYKYVNSSDTNSRYAFDVVMKVFLGVKITDELASSLPFDIREFVNYSVKATDAAVRLDSKFPMYKYFKTKEYESFEKLMDKSTEYAKYCIQRFKTNPSQNPRLLELMQERAKELDRPDERIESVLIQFLQAGVDVTVKMLNHCYHRLAHHPELQQKIYEESVAVFGEPSMEELTSENGLSLTMEQYKQLKYTRIFIEEVLRLDLFTHLASGRQLTQDTEIGGYMIPKDTLILVQQKWATLKDEYVPRGAEFIPERHEKGSPLAPVNNYVSMPFGVGARRCPGARIATTEIHLGIINAVRHFVLSNNNLPNFPPFSHDAALLFIDSDKYPLYFTPRRDQVKDFVEKKEKK